MHLFVRIICFSIVLLWIIIDTNSTELDSAVEVQIKSLLPLSNDLSSSQMCLLSSSKVNRNYSNSTFTLHVQSGFRKNKSFDIVTSLNTSIYELKKIIEQRSGLPCDQQELQFISDVEFASYRNVQDNLKLGDYISNQDHVCKYVLRVYRRRRKPKFVFNILPNVTHYEYVRMSSHVYQPEDPFLPGWHVRKLDFPNRNGLFLAAYINAERHQCVISARGTDLTKGFLFNPITDLRLLFTNQAIDTFDSARTMLFHDGTLHLPYSNDSSYVISFTGHSLGAALAESLACTYKGYAVTFDSPGTRHILHNDPSCEKNIEDGYNVTEHVHTYLGTYANIINVANPQSGQVIYLKHFGAGDDPRSNEFFYIYSSAAGVYIAACIFANIVDKSMFQLGLWFTIGFFIKESAIISLLRYSFDVNWNYLISQLPFIVVIYLLCRAVSSLADSIEQRIDQICTYLSLRNMPLINRFIIFIETRIKFNGVVGRCTLLLMYIGLAFLVCVGIPIYCYSQWLLSAHSINKFVDSFNPESGMVYYEEVAERILWPTLSEYITKIASRQFLLFLLIIQSMRLIASYMLPQCFPHRLRFNLCLILFSAFFNVNSIKYLLCGFTLFLILLFLTARQDKQRYTRDLTCAVSGLLAMIQLMEESHKIYCEAIGCSSLFLIPFIGKLRLFSSRLLKSTQFSHVKLE
ncbi:unnamed protein product [Adineta ricciae]|uniref:Ubiquitin-like domain-containing protein n=1 Tax=Adineta ricciae TaxID=249248 RepID=A0A815U8L5_ADIRI|nr:unnamed protein product [Adineta ricciae]